MTPAQNAFAPAFPVRQAPTKGTGLLLLVAALGALAGGAATLHTACERSLSIVNDPVLIALGVNGVAAVLVVIALAKLIPGKGLLFGLLAAGAWSGGGGLLLNASLEENSAAAHKRWASESAVMRVDDICRGETSHDDRARAFDPSAKTHGVVVVHDSGIPSTRPYVRPDNGLLIEDADLVLCAKDSEETVETCTYDGYRRMSRQRVHTEVRFVSIKTGEELWRTTLTGAEPRPCGASEEFYGASRSNSIRGHAPDPRSALAQFLAR
jgi:hypothetical protein